MASNVNVRVFGTKQVEAAFKALPEKVQRKVQREGMTTGARIVRSRARELVAVDTGKLKKSIKVRGLKNAKQSAFLNKKLGGSRSVPIGRQVIADAPHAHLIEEGTKRMAARPFLRKAMDEKEPAVFEAIADSVKKAIKEA